MFEKSYLLETIEPIEFYGVEDSKMNVIRSFFPKLKIIARDRNIKVNGTLEDIQSFEHKLELIVSYYSRYKNYTVENLKDLLETNSSNGKIGSMLTEHDVLLYGNNGKPIKARTSNQRELVKLSLNNDLVFATGPAGSGKTYTAVALAVRALKAKEVKRIILCRPAVEAEENLGFLPGDMREKLNPYLQPLYDALQDMIHPRKLDEMYSDNIIQIAPLAYMRGRTLDKAFVILDEAQNASLNQLKMFLTRMGEHAKFIITGDVTQIDLPDKSKSGLRTALSMFEKTEGIGMIKFESKDIIRHKLVKDIVAAFDELKNTENNN